MLIKKLAVLGLVGLTFALSGCYLGVFQTAQALREGDVMFTLGAAYHSFTWEGDVLSSLVPQLRLAVGVADGVELGVHTGVMLSLISWESAFLGALADLKIALWDEPEAFALALSLGGGWGVLTGGWGLSGGVYFDSNVRILPIYFAYRPFFSFEEQEFAHQFAVGLKLNLSPTARLLLEADNFMGLWSLGLALAIAF
jgi:hypothetical protein